MVTTGKTARGGSGKFPTATNAKPYLTRFSAPLCIRTWWKRLSIGMLAG